MFIAMVFGWWVGQMTLATHALEDCKKDMSHKACIVNEKIQVIANKMCELQDPHPDCKK